MGKISRMQDVLFTICRKGGGGGDEREVTSTIDRKKKINMK